MTAQSSSLASAYAKLTQSIYENRSTPFSTKARLESILPELHLSEVWISDFYDLPQFGKSQLGNLIHAAKTSDKNSFTKTIYNLVRLDIQKILKHNFDAVAFVPHSIPRKRQFLPELKKLLKLSLPEIKIEKLFPGGVPVAQKSLSSAAERIENASETMFVSGSSVIGEKILVIDDAIGSGATLNAVAQKLKHRGAKKVCGYAIVGSFKGIDVISQV